MGTGMHSGDDGGQRLTMLADSSSSDMSSRGQIGPPTHLHLRRARGAGPCRKRDTSGSGAGVGAVCTQASTWDGSITGALGAGGDRRWRSSLSSAGSGEEAVPGRHSPGQPRPSRISP